MIAKIFPTIRILLNNLNWYYGLLSCFILIYWIEMINVKSKSKMIIVLAQVNIDSYNSSTGSKLWVKSLVF